MSYDFFAQMSGSTLKDVDDIVKGCYKNLDITSIASRIHLLTTMAANDGVKDYAIRGDRRPGGYISLVHSRSDTELNPYCKELISPALDNLKNLGISRNDIDIQLLSRGSWFLCFTFNLISPWLSKDDEPFYLSDSVNPVRKDKIFKVPIMPASSWKGVLRWVLMKIYLEQEKDELTAEQFAQERFAQTLLFGDEQGEKHSEMKGFAKYIDKLKPEARAEYESLLRQYFKVEPNQPFPHHRGRLMFYPSFFDGIDVEVINPHSRETKAGTHPIYLECVPSKPSSTATFTLLYTPFDCFCRNKNETRRQVAADLKRVAQGVRGMLTTYGFGAKTSSGYGTADNRLAESGKLVIKANITCPSSAGEGNEEASEVSECSFDSLDELCNIAERFADELRKGGDA